MSPAEQLTSQFYQWEMLGRGWLSFDAPVHLEAPFTPFFGHFLWHKPTYKDDGLRHTILSKALSLLKGQEKQVVESALPDITYCPFAFLDDEDIVYYHILLEKGNKYAQSETEHFLSMLSYCTKPISFELIGTQEKITIQLTCRQSDALYVRAQVQTYFPKVSLIEVIDAFPDITDRACATVDFGLEHEFTRPLSNHHSIDPFTPLFSVLEHLREGEGVIFQVLCNGVINKWEPSIMRAVSDERGGSFFQNAPDMLSLARQKSGKSLLAASVRCVTLAHSTNEAFAILHKLGFAIQKTYTSTSNSLVHLSNEDYTIAQRISDIYLRRSHRLGMLLNIEELSSLFHLPSPSLISNKVLGRHRKTKLPPSLAEGHRFILGISEHAGEQVTVSLPNTHRLKHTHILGATGTGKSTLLCSMIIQDMELGNGVAVLDPHGDLIETVLRYLPPNRIHDVVIIDPSDSEFPVGFNILQAHSDIEKETLSSDLVSAFKRLSTSWGDQMHSVLSNAILAFLESTEGGTLIDLRRFLLETPFRNDFLKTVHDYSILYYWQKQYPILKSGSIGPILTRLDNFLRSRLIRNMVAQKKGLDFEKLLDGQKILLIKLSQGLIGEENSYLLGSFIVSKIHQAALARQARELRRDYFLYIDEFQHFITPSLSAILSGARKYHLGLVLAHQDMQQLQRGDHELTGSLVSNIGTRICFRLGDSDAKKLAEGFSSFEAQDLQNLNTGEAIARIEKPEFDFSFNTTALKESEATNQTDFIRTHSRCRYATPREEIEEALFASLQLGKEDISMPTNPKSNKRILAPAPTEATEPEGHKQTAQASMLSKDKIEEVTSRVVQQKEESTHRYLQNLIKRVAESHGYKATLEAMLQNGEGKVDVLLEQGRQKIACEVSVTTGTSWEMHNIKKCLNAGCTLVLSCISETKSIASVTRKIAETFTDKEQQRIKVFDPESLLLYLETLTSGPIKKESTIKGYRVTVSHNGISGEEQKQKKDAIARVVAESLQKKKHS